MKYRSMYFISLIGFLIFFNDVFSQQILDEMQIIDISDNTSIQRQLVRNPEEAILIVKTQIAEMRIQSNNTIHNITETDPGTWQIKLVPGTHIISFQAKGFISTKQRFYFNPKDTKGVRIIVVPAAERKEEKNSGTIVVQSKPEGAEVYFNDQYYGTTPYIGKMISGRYNLKIQKQNFLPAFKEIIIVPYETVPVEIELKQTIGELSRTIDQKDQKKLQIAVLDFSSGNTILAEETQTLTDRFRGEMVQTGTFTVISRKNMNSILDEIGFQLSGCTSKECAVEAGKILNVEKMISGTIGLIGNTYTISVSFIDVESAKIEHSIMRDYRGEKDGLLSMIKQIAEDISTKYTAGGEPSSNYWLWIAGGGAVLGATLYFILQPDDSENEKKLPDLGGIWPPD